MSNNKTSRGKGIGLTGFKRDSGSGNRDKYSGGGSKKSPKSK